MQGRLLGKLLIGLSGDYKTKDILFAKIISVLTFLHSVLEIVNNIVYTQSIA